MESKYIKGLQLSVNGQPEQCLEEFDEYCGSCPIGQESCEDCPRYCDDCDGKCDCEDCDEEIEAKADLIKKYGE